MDVSNLRSDVRDINYTYHNVCVHNRRLRSKNRKLVENLHKLDQMGGVKAFYEWSVDEKTEHDGTEIIAEEERELYGKIVSYLSAENRFAETQISRDTLASALGTNRTYIANAIKKCTGLAVNEYVISFVWSMHVDYSRKTGR